VVTDVDDRGHLDAAEGRLPPGLVVERADPDQPVDAVLAAQRPERVGSADLEGGALQPGLLRVGGVEYLRRVAVPLRPPQVHAQEHLGPVRGVDPAGAGGELHDRLALVVLAGEQRPHLEAGDLPAELRQVLLDLGDQIRVLEVHAGLGVLEPATQALDAVDVGPHPGELARHALGPGLVAPQLRVTGLLLEVVQLLAQARHVEHRLDAGEGAVELLQLLGEVVGHTSRLRRRRLSS
jgi:hypothetical protein